MPEELGQALRLLSWAALDSTACKDSALAYMWHHVLVIQVWPCIAHGCRFQNCNKLKKTGFHKMMIDTDEVSFPISLLVGAAYLCWRVLHVRLLSEQSFSTSWGWSVSVHCAQTSSGGCICQTSQAGACCFAALFSTVACLLSRVQVLHSELW